MASLGLRIFLFLLSLALVPAALGGFSADLIHRDSPVSPLRNSSATLFDRWRLAAERSQERVRHFASRRISPSGIVSPVTPTTGEYLMKLSLGTPPFDIHAIADTGSDLTWTNCIPCTDCYQQKDPLFDPAKSTTYSNVTCGDDSCNALPSQSCDVSDNCQYRYSYGDESTVIGLLAKENFTFAATSGDDVTVASTVFGCSHLSKGTFQESVGGLVGLGGGELSLVSQLGDSIKNQFSYCLLPYADVGNSSMLVFGPNDDHAPSGNISKTPLIKNPQMSTFYYLTLNNIIVGQKSIPVAASEPSAASSGNIIIDSGTTLTILEQSVVDAVVAEVKKVVTLPPVDDPRYSAFGACFAVDGTEKDLKFPLITFAFDGADVPLKTENMLVQVDQNVMCLALTSAEGSVGIQIYGNIAQQGFYVGYDLGQQQLSIASANCADL